MAKNPQELASHYGVPNYLGTPQLFLQTFNNP